MRTLVEEIIRAVAVAEVIKLPRLVRWASASDDILINENLNGPDVPGEVAGILVGLRKLVIGFVILGPVEMLVFDQNLT